MNWLSIDPANMTGIVRWQDTAPISIGTLRPAKATEAKRASKPGATFCYGVTTLETLIACWAWTARGPGVDQRRPARAGVIGGEAMEVIRTDGKGKPVIEIVWTAPRCICGLISWTLDYDGELDWPRMAVTCSCGVVVPLAFEAAVPRFAPRPE